MAKTMVKLFQGKRVGVIGLGVSGLATVRFLLRMGVKPVLMDTRNKLAGLETINPDKVDGIYLGELDANRLAKMDILLVSPGLDLSHPSIRFAMAQGVQIIGDVELFALVNQKPVVAVTGSNGKSTVTTLAEHMLNCSGLRALAAGNIGLAVLDALEKTETDVYVLELSSFQLETTHSLKLQAAANLNVTEDHLDRHGTMAAYAAAKQRIYLHTDLAIYNADDQYTVPQGLAAPAIALQLLSERDGYGIRMVDGEKYLLVAGEPLLPVRQMTLVGLHNQFNALAACAMALAVGATREGLIRALTTYQALPHRCTLVTDHQGVRYIDDSKATNVGATLAAIAGLRGDVTGRLILIAGGDGKGVDFAELAKVLQAQVDQVITLGRDGPAIAQLVPGCIEVNSLQQAVETAVKLAQPGDMVLLSPACASLDMFKNYEERGRLFAQYVLQAVS